MSTSNERLKNAKKKKTKLWQDMLKIGYTLKNRKDITDKATKSLNK